MASNKKGGILSKVPLPDTFFSIKHQLRPIASISVSAPSAILIYLLTIGGFVGCWWFYSLPNPPQTVTVIQSEWQKAGYECNPLQEESHYSVMWSYDTCLEKIRAPSTSSLTTECDATEPGACPTTTSPLLNEPGSKHTTKYYPFDGVNKAYIQENGVEFYCTNAGQQREGTTIASSKMLCKEELSETWSADKVCKRFKTNAPFQCTKTTVTYKSDLEKLSLSVANTQLLFGTLTALFATLFYKLKRNDKIQSTTSDENTWQDAVKALQQEIQELKRNKVDKKASV